MEPKQEGTPTTQNNQASCINKAAEQKSSTEIGKKVITDNHELLSDGSASAFEGTEFRDNQDRLQERTSLDRKKKNYPSGLSDY